MRIYWTKEEENFLSHQYLDIGMSVSEIYPNHILIYPHRTMVSLKLKIKKMKLRHSKEQTSKIKTRIYSGEGNGMFGKVGANNGLNKKNSSRIRKASEKISHTRKKLYKDGKLPSLAGNKNPMYGKDSWSKGKTKYDNEILRKAGQKNSISQRKRWDNLDKKDKEDIIGRLTLAATKARKNTKIEIIVKNVLDSMDIKYYNNYRFKKFVFDFYLPDFNFVIECQGDYWHGNPELFDKLNDTQSKNKERDKIKIEYLDSSKTKYLFLWENEIHRYKNTLKDIIWQQLIEKQEIV